MRRFLRVMVWIALGCAGIAVLVLALLHLPPMQRMLFRRAAREIEAASGWRVEAGTISMRLWPARLKASDVRAEVEGRRVASAGAIDLSWAWHSVLGEVPRVERVVISDLDVDLRAMPVAAPDEDEQPTAIDPLRVVEIADLELRDSSLMAAAGETLIGVEELRLGASLVNAQARLELSAGRLRLDRDARVLELGSLELQAGAGPDGVVVDRLIVGGGPLDVAISGHLPGLDGAGPGQLELRLAAAPEGLIEWWDPSLLARAGHPSVQGRLKLDGQLMLDGADGYELRLSQDQDGLVVADLPIRRLELVVAPDRVEGVLADPSWGEVVARAPGPEGPFVVTARLEDASLEPARAMVASLGLLPGEIDRRLAGPLRVDGRLQATVAMPVRLETLVLDAELAIRTAVESLKVEARAEGGVLKIARLEAKVPGAVVAVAGRVDAGPAFAGAGGPGGLGGPGGPGEGSAVEWGRARAEARLKLDIDHPAATEAWLRSWMSALPVVPVDGGPLHLEATVHGPLERLQGRCSARWTGIVAFGVAVDAVELEVEGDQNRLEWQVRTAAAGGTEVVAGGELRPEIPAVRGQWEMTVADLTGVLAGLPLDLPESIGGAVAGAGTMRWQPTTWEAAGTLSGQGLTYGPWRADRLELEGGFDGARIELVGAELEAHGAHLVAHGSAAAQDLEAPLRLEVAFDGLDLAALPLQLPEQAHRAAGPISGRLDVRGSLARPEAWLEAEWQPVDQAAVDRLGIKAALEQGMLRVTTQSFQTAAGAVAVQGSVGLGHLPRPDWLWPEAPDEAIRVLVQGAALEIAPMLVALGLDIPDLDLRTDLRVDARWDLSDPEQRLVEVLLDDLELTVNGQHLRSTEPLMVSLAGQQVVLAPAVLTGEQGLVQLEGALDLATQEVHARAHARIGPELARLLPVPMQVRGPFELDLALDGPMSRMDGKVVLDHAGGELVMRDPPVRISDLHLEASLDDGVLSITDGQAVVNRGKVLIGGGWDPVSGQGIVLELDGVSFLLSDGILTRWQGNLAIEPVPDRLARVVGDLELLGGVWDQPVDLTGMLLGGTAAGVAPDDPLHDVVLDLDVRGRGGIHVENNLGSFDVRWDTVHVSGTAALPLVDGQLRLDQGGTFNLSGRSITIRRGVIELVGEAGVPPRIEIVPEQSYSFGGGVAADGSDGAAAFDVELAARKGLAQGVGSALGLRNKSLRPAMISAETETDPGTRLSVGQMINRRLAFFFTADLTDVQDRTTMLQMFNLDMVPGLALQAFSSTLGEHGYAVVERLRWGSSAATDERPQVYKVKLEGDWPMSSWRLRRATGLTKGQPFDEFMLFAAAVRLERELASRGYYQARVEGSKRGDPRLPTLAFRCDSGPRQEVVFAGSHLSGKLRRKVVSLYQAPPFESAAFAAMSTMLERELAAAGYADAAVLVTRDGETVRVHVERGPKLELQGPIVEGVDGESARVVALMLSSPAALAQLRSHPQLAARRVEQTLAAQGYRQATMRGVRSVRLDEHTDELHIDVDPGPRARISEIQIRGDDPLGLADDIELAAGQPLDRSRVDRAVRWLRNGYQEAAYVDCEVESRMTQGAGGRWRVVLEIRPGVRRRISEVRLVGLRYLHERLLRKSIDLHQGEPLRISEVDRAASALAGFAPIERVAVETTPDSEDTTRVDLVITERPRWTAGLGARWSSDTGLETVLDLRDDNLLGRGLSLNLRGRYGGVNRFASLIGSWPVAPGGRLAGSATMTYRRGEEPSDPESLLREERTATFEVSYQLGGQRWLRSYLQYSRVHSIPNAPLVFFVPDDVDVASLGAQFVQDRLDDQFDPRSGSYLTVDLSWSSELLGSDFDSVRSLVTYSRVLEPWHDWTWLQMARLGAAEPLAGQDLLRKEARFYAGGQASIRGFDLNAVGPLRLADQGDTLEGRGGGALAIFNEELRMPLWRQLRLALFVDVGQVWTSWSETDTDMAVGAGLGLRYATPVGPIWADVAWPVLNRTISEGPKYAVGIGRTF